ncbi:transcriptional regulator, Sir2 family [Emiliania huxleyi CCMP1516]|uniref:Deacetylase sirtuin-type domain-containing protein n=3 Tax=Emiliania huxleyi TaxID=2903 RepID=A0A0D3IKX2_EMIH1|nr:transcriptional regulator, Sir2 family [Emiliania huxleyi CCMP1516]EOD11907.1 transcriptional regulator, Sir2 family [Emiliania huxleyi CCMP1516]|eukprot:XP_005764336.1 transcriptional regulator, Sir2 family [Emiliania huxleyi CCMP1516]
MSTPSPLAATALSLDDTLARIIRRGDPVVFVTGSGLSAPSGIPTFRGAEGVWAKWVLEWGTRAAFLADPRGWYDNFWIPAHVVAEPGSTSERTYEPSAGHFAVAEVAACRQTNVHVITQNIDGLHQRAGLPSERLVEVHGRAGLLKCVSPGCRYAAAESIGPAQLDLATATAEWEADAKGPDVTPDPALRARVVVHLRLRPAGGGVRATCAVERQAAPCDPKATRTVLGALPTCPACGAPALPQALLFDEEYESHSFYQYRKARRWLDGSGGQALVFVGTSFAVGVTEHALLGAPRRQPRAAERSLPSFSFNIVPESATQAHEAGGELGGARQHAPPMHHIVGCCEAPPQAQRSAPRRHTPHAVVPCPQVTLPKLAALVASPLAAKAADWYEGWIPPHAEAAALEGLGSEWSELLTGGTTWVACDACGKWRRLPAGVALDEEEASARWWCRQNVWDPTRATCEAEEEPW